MALITDAFNASEEILTGNNEKLSDFGFAMCAIALFFIGVFGLTNNFSVFYILLKYKEVKSPINMILLNLAVSDTGMCLVGSPISFIAAVNHKWIYGDLMCTIYGFLMSFFGITSITTLTALSFERCFIITRAFPYTPKNNRRSLFIIASTWFYSLCVTVPPLFGWGKYSLEGPDISCSVNWMMHSWHNSSYIMYLFTFGFFVPILIMMYSYINIIRIVHQTRRIKGLVSRTAKADTKLALMVMVMSLAFLIAWTPYAVVSLVTVLKHDAQIPPEAAVTPAILAKSSCIYNPIIYVWLNSQFRKIWEKMFCCSAISGEISSQQVTENVSMTNYNPKWKISHHLKSQSTEDV